ncbi:MAG: deoxyribonuclease IV [Dehalococcoidia bacterium]
MTTTAGKATSSKAKPAAKHVATMQVGGHISSSGGLYRAIERATACEMEAIQVFCAPPQTWRATKHTDDDIARYRDAHAASGIGQVWIHNIYLANLATDKPEQLEKSIGSVVNALQVAERMGAQGVVLHTGSHRGLGVEAVLEQVVGAINVILEQAPGEAVLALETMAGQGGAIGTRFEDLGMLIREVGSPRLKTCLDTAHTFAAGYEIHTPEGLDRAMAEFDRHIGLELLAVVHVNDSKVPLGAFRDRHENIGDGEIGTSGFDAMLAHPAFAGRALLLEVPGIPTEASPKGDGPDLENVRRLKAIRDRAASKA